MLLISKKPIFCRQNRNLKDVEEEPADERSADSRPTIPPLGASGRTGDAQRFYGGFAATFRDRPSPSLNCSLDPLRHLPEIGYGGASDRSPLAAWRRSQLEASGALPLPWSPAPGRTIQQRVDALCAFRNQDASHRLAMARQRLRLRPKLFGPFSTFAASDPRLDPTARPSPAAADSASNSSTQQAATVQPESSSSNLKIQTNRKRLISNDSDDPDDADFSTKSTRSKISNNKNDNASNSSSRSSTGASRQIPPTPPPPPPPPPPPIEIIRLGGAARRQKQLARDRISLCSAADTAAAARDAATVYEIISSSSDEEEIAKRRADKTVGGSLKLTNSSKKRPKTVGTDPDDGYHKIKCPVCGQSVPKNVSLQEHANECLENEQN